MKNRSKFRSLIGSLSLAMIAASAVAESPINYKDLGIVSEKPVEGIYVQVGDAFMVPYSMPIPGTEIQFTMIPVPAGKFMMGSPEDETGHQSDEGPQREVSVPPFWIGKTELTWAEYKVFMGMYPILKQLVSQKVRPITKDNRVDAITVPTPLYDPGHTYKLGSRPQQPAVTMTQYAAKQYTKWLSGLSGLQYRLPTEAEWEYAARAGSTTAYSFGDDVSKLPEFAVFAENAEVGAADVASLKPNAFGLYDMHGNAWEWVIDGYRKDGYPAGEKNTLEMIDAIDWPTAAYPRTVRGGGFQDDADRLRSAAKMGSDDEDWKGSDPNIPLSPWWFTDDPARSVGMRLARSYEPMAKELITKFWNIDNEDIELDVDIRLDEGRGVLAIPAPELAEDIKSSL